MENIDHVKGMVSLALERRGVLSKLRAQLRAEVFAAIEEQAEATKAPANSMNMPGWKTAMQVVVEFLKFYDLGHTLAVLNKEASLPVNQEQDVDRSRLWSRVTSDYRSQCPAGQPVLGALLEVVQHQEEMRRSASASPLQSPSVSPSPSRSPSPTSTNASHLAPPPPLSLAKEPSPLLSSSASLASSSPPPISGPPLSMSGPALPALAPIISRTNSAPIVIPSVDKVSEIDLLLKQLDLKQAEADNAKLKLEEAEKDEDREVDGYSDDDAIDFEDDELESSLYGTMCASDKCGSMFTPDVSVSVDTDVLFPKFASASASATLDPSSNDTDDDIDLIESFSDDLSADEDALDSFDVVYSARLKAPPFH